MKCCTVFESVPMIKWSEIVSQLNPSKLDAVNKEFFSNIPIHLNTVCFSTKSTILGFLTFFKVIDDNSSLKCAHLESFTTKSPGPRPDNSNLSRVQLLVSLLKLSKISKGFRIVSQFEVPKCLQTSES